MTSKTVFMFSGQGSQYFKMGMELMQCNETFRMEMQRLDTIAAPLVGRSIAGLIYDPDHSKADTFDRLLFTHPAIYMVEVALARTLMSLDIVPDIVLGASLGTFAAAAIGGFVSTEDALVALINQARAIESHCCAGGMIAILAAPEVFERSSIASLGEIGARNFGTHFVVSAPEANLPAIERELRSQDITFQRLPVSYPFHSRWIDGAREAIERATATLASCTATCPLACCATSGLITGLDSTHFWEVARRPIAFQRLIEVLEQAGPHRYVDVGPSGTLSTFLRYALDERSGSRAVSILSPFGSDARRLASARASLQTSERAS